MKIPPARIVFSGDDRREILALIDESLRSGALTLGPRTRAFEDAFARRHDAEHAVAVASGTAALEIVFRCLDVAGGEVVVPANTFYATAGAVVHAGGTPRLADIDVATLALSPATIETALTERTRAVVLVHIGGLITPAVDAIARLCQERGIALVEDAAHAHGSSFDGRMAGTFGRAATFSFYPTKVLTSGEGGMIVTADPEIAERARVFRDQGKAGFVGGAHIELGYAWRMSELHAAVGLIHLRRLDEFIARRTEIAHLYDEALHDVDAIAPLTVPDECVSNFYKYVALLAPGVERSAIEPRAADRGVSLSGPVYARPLHLEPVFASVDHGPLPVAEDVCARHICLPLHSDMTHDEAEAVIAGVRWALGD